MLSTELSPELATLVERAGARYFREPGDEPMPAASEGAPLIAGPADVAGLAAILRTANELGLKVAPRGSGTRLGLGNPLSRLDLVLDMSGFDAIVEHAAGDLTVRVQAGVPLERLQAALAGAGQFLALDPLVPGTVGGLIATNDSGPRRVRYGGVRDQILGVTFARPDGVIAHGGGKVVKNVAGYDLPKLFAGSLGTLGVIVEAVFRLYAVPPASATLLATRCSPLEARHFAARILDSTLVPTMLDYALVDGIGKFGARFEAPAASAAAQAARAATMLGRGDLEILSGAGEHELWSRLDAIATAPLLARLIAPTAELGSILDRAVSQAAAAGAMLAVRAHMGHGHALLSWEGAAEDGSAMLILDLRRACEQRDGNLVLWRAPSGVREGVEAWGSAGEGLGLMRRLKAEFDPRATLNPGRFVGGI